MEAEGWKTSTPGLSVWSYRPHPELPEFLRRWTFGAPLAPARGGEPQKQLCICYGQCQVRKWRFWDVTVVSGVTQAETKSCWFSAPWPSRPTLPPSGAPAQGVQPRQQRAPSALRLQLMGDPEDSCPNLCFSHDSLPLSQFTVFPGFRVTKIINIHSYWKLPLCSRCFLCINLVWP